MDLEEQLHDRYGGWECACHGNVHVMGMCMSLLQKCMQRYIAVTYNPNMHIKFISQTDIQANDRVLCGGCYYSQDKSATLLHSQW